MRMTRRTVLALPGALLLTRCAGTASLTPAQVVTDLANGAAMLVSDLPLMAAAAPGLLPAATVTTLEQYASEAQSVAQTLSANLPASQAASAVQTALAYLNDVLNTLAAPPVNGLIPAPYNVAVQALDVAVVQVLEPWLASVTGTAAAPAPFARAALRAAQPEMTVAEAEAILAQEAAR